MPSDPTDAARRRVLLAAAAAPLVLVATGCTDEPAPQVVADPDREALESAYGVEDELRRLLSRWMSAADATRTRAEDIVVEHLDALRASLGGVLGNEPLPTTSASESDPAADAVTTTGLVRALGAAADAHSAALRTAGAEVSPLLASIAASDAALAASLRAGR